MQRLCAAAALATTGSTLSFFYLLTHSLLLYSLPPPLAPPSLLLVATHYMYQVGEAALPRAADHVADGRGLSPLLRAAEGTY